MIKTFDDKLELVLEMVGPRTSYSKSDILRRFDSWYVYFLNPADKDGIKEIDRAFGEVWGSDESPLVKLCITGIALDRGLPFENDLSVKYTLAPNGDPVKMMSDDLMHHSQNDIAAIVELLFVEHPDAKKAVEDGLVLLRQKPIVPVKSKSNKLSDEDEWVSKSGKSKKRYPINYKVLGSGVLGSGDLGMQDTKT